MKFLLLSLLHIFLEGFFVLFSVFIRNIKEPHFICSQLCSNCVFVHEL